MSKDFPKKLKAIRDNNKWSLEYMAKVLDTNKQTLSRYERGERVPKITVVADYAKKLGVPLNELAGENDYPIIKKQRKAIYPAVVKKPLAGVVRVEKVTVEEKELQRLWKKATPRFKSAVIEMLRSVDVDDK